MSEIAQSLNLTRKTFPLEQAEALIIALDEAQRVILLAEGLAIGPARNMGACLEAAGYNIHISSGSLSDLARALVGARRGNMVIVIDVERKINMIEVGRSKPVENYYPAVFNSTTTRIIE